MMREEYAEYINHVSELALSESVKHLPIKLIEFMVLSYQNKFKKQFKILLMAEDPKYDSMKDLPMKQKEEPQDYLNLVMTYRFFLEQLQVTASYSETVYESHEDFLRKETVSRGLIQGVHNYMMRRLHRSIFVRMNPSKKDIRLHHLLITGKKFNLDVKKDDGTYLFAEVTRDPEIY